jgi:cob(I)alamin adenosyltransferase
MKIYTKTGDCGTTGLFAGPRVAKDHPRIEAYGAVDELSAALGVAISTLQQVADGAIPQPVRIPDLRALAEGLSGVQHDLFAIGAELATPEPDKHGMCLLSSDRIVQLEQWIDQMDGQLPQLENFILPGGSYAAAVLQLGRTVCRRAERRLVHLAHECRSYTTVAGW